MPEWKFLVARSYGGLQQRYDLCSRIRHFVKQNRLETVVPLVKYEISRGREYYFGIAFDENDSDASDFAHKVLVILGITSETAAQQGFVVDAHDVNSLLRGNLECESFTIPISYEKENVSERINSEYIISLFESQGLQNEKLSGYLENPLDKLLYWCSSYTTGSFHLLNRVCELLSISDDSSVTWSIIRRFVLLGHLEIKIDGTIKWGVVPPVLIRTAIGNNLVLVGSRSPSLVSHLKSKFGFFESCQLDGPSHLAVSNINGYAESLLEKLPEIANLGFVSLKLSQLLPPVSTWIKSMPLLEYEIPAECALERYSPEEDEFNQVELDDELRSGFYKFGLVNSVGKKEPFAYFNSDIGKWISGDFYGLRFIARQLSGVCKAIYATKSEILLIPSRDRWPMPYERALVLASGKLPCKLNQNYGAPLLAYYGVSYELASRLCSLLELKMETDAVS